MKLTYVYDAETKYFQNVFEAEDGETVENSTELKPADGLYDPKWNGSKWVGKTLEQFIEDHKDDQQEPVLPSEQDKINAQLLQQAAEQQITNAAIVKQIATIKGGK